MVTLREVAIINGNLINPSAPTQIHRYSEGDSAWRRASTLRKTAVIPVVAATVATAAATVAVVAAVLVEWWESRCCA